MNWRIVAAAGALALAAACGTSENTKPAEQAKSSEAAGQPGAGGQQSAGEQQTAQGAQQTAQGAQQMAQGMQQMAQGLQQMAQGAAKPVDYEQLKAFLPDLNGWTKDTTKGSQATSPIAYSKVETTYANGASSIDMDITDTALSQIFLAPLSMFMAAGYQEKSDDGYKKAISVGGSPGFEEWDNNSKTAEVTLIVANRFVVHAKGEGVESTDPVKKAVQTIDLSKLASLK
jgi:hypothetical protein